MSGPFGAGAILVCRDAGSGGWCALFQQRSASEHEPGSWSVYGGMAEGRERAIPCMIREVREEAGIDVAGLPLWLLDRFAGAGGFAFYTFLVVLPERVEPVHSAETQAARWIPLGGDEASLWSGLPTPLHSGLAAFVAKPGIARRVLRIIETR